jgi:hypothetical protein
MTTGGQHSFGQGGILDYGDGRLPSSHPLSPGEYGFAEATRPGICSHLALATRGANRLYSRNARVPLSRCFSASAGGRCGDGVVDPGEQCDAGGQPNACCGPDCRLRGAATCWRESACCRGCRAVDSSQTCGEGRGKGYCSAGRCVSSACNAFANAAPCGLHPRNACRERCQLGSRCVGLGNDPTPLAAGSYCALDGDGAEGVCVGEGEGAGTVCRAKEYRWGQGEGGARVCVENGAREVGPGLCEGQEENK